MSKPGDKIIFEQRSKCPYCSKLIVTRLVRNTIKKGEPAQTELRFFIEKESQTTFDEDYEASRKQQIKEAKARRVKHERR